MKLHCSKHLFSKLIVLSLTLLFFSLSTSVPISAQSINFQPAELQVVQDICDKKIVLLGELPSHGEAKTFQVKATIVKELVLNCGFDALIFESPIYDFLGLLETKSENRALPEQLENAIGGFWTTVELKPWLNWLFTEFNDKNLYLGGLDDQVSATSKFARSTLPGLLSNKALSDVAESCEQIVERNLFWRYGIEHKYDSEEKMNLELCAKITLAAYDIRMKQEFSINDKIMIENITNLYTRQRGGVEALDRDERMYRNLIWHIEQLTKKSKIIVWTSTVHSSKKQGELEYKPMGTWVSENWNDSLAAIGFSAFSGQSSMAGMPSFIMNKLPSHYLEALATKGDTSWVYFDNSILQDIGYIPSRLFGKVTSANWSSLFDGVLIIREEVAPTFEQK